MPCFCLLFFFIYWGIPHKFRWLLLLASSYYFYMSWNVKYVILIFFTTAISFFAAILIENEQRNRNKKAILLVAAILCLGVLFVFKYLNFTISTFAEVVSFVGIKLSPQTIKLLLPVGISFYTFQTISYITDVYRGEIEAEHNFGYYATFISFFPQLVAGPIERTNNLLPQIKTEHFFDYDNASYGLKRILWGLFKKMCIADAIAFYVDSVYASLDANTGFHLFLAVIGFSIQIYCDFSGYSDIAIGTARMLGITLMENFKSPYYSKSIKEFWSRWHISLSTWFRDYFYIPIGGNRRSKFRNAINLFMTFLLSGLWHGANWTFIIWGGIHGAAQLLERMIQKSFKFYNRHWLYSIFSWFVVFSFCNIAWVFFRAESLKDAIFVISHMFSGICKWKQYLGNKSGLEYFEYAKMLFVLIILAGYDLVSLQKDVILWLGEQKIVIRWIVYIFLVMWIFLFASVGEKNFLYFQF